MPQETGWQKGQRGLHTLTNSARTKESKNIKERDTSATPPVSPDPRTQGPTPSPDQSLSSHPFLKSFIVALGSWQTPLTRKATEAVPARKSRKSRSQTVTNAAKHLGHILKWDSGLFDLFVARNFRGRKFRFTMWLAAFCKPKNCTYQLPLGETDAFGFEVLPKVAVQIICKSRFTYDDLGMGRATCICLPEKSDGFESLSFGEQMGTFWASSHKFLLLDPCPHLTLI